MAIEFIDVLDYCWGENLFIRPISQNQTMNTVRDIEYKAIDASGTLGSLYNARQNSIIKGEHIPARGKTLHLSEPAHCQIKKNIMDGNLNLLQFIGIQEDLRINLLLEITKRIGIAAVMNYPDRIDQYTRFLYYSSPTRTEQIIDTPEQLRKLTQSSDPQFAATHIITSIDYGIDLIAIIQLTNDIHINNQIDQVLQQIEYALSNNNTSFIQKKIDPFEQMINVTIHSNTSTFTNITKVSDMIYQINSIKNHCHPITYHLRPTKWLDQNYEANNAAFKVIPHQINEQIERKLLQLRTQIKYLDKSLKDHIPTSLGGHIQDRIFDARWECLSIIDIYKNKTKRIHDLVIGVRSGIYDSSTISQELQHSEQILLQNRIDQLIENVDQLEGQSQINNDYSRQQSSKNYRGSDQYFNEIDIGRNIKSIRKEDHRSKEILYKNGTSNNFDQDLMDGHKLNRDVSTKSNISPSSQLEEETNKIDYNTNQSSNIDLLDSSLRDDIINILLLGETGVGKSTFINAFVNYLSFDRLEQAQLNKPNVIIPVQFLTTVGDNFEERIVKFVDINNCSNEDFNDSGQSVTQDCKSYLFSVNDGTKFCLIDTPGFGDTRGFCQDEQNMEKILKYLNHLKHINAICFLLKPNSSRLNIFFRSCFTQLIQFLGPNISRNITFCFTNSRSTFYSPGDTAPLIKSMINSLSINDIPFKKENTFCFDNQSFRYLVARQNQIPFTDEDKRKCEKSWSISVKESCRLIEYIRMKLPINYIKDGWKSLKHGQLEIIHFIRPILETMRNILRNLILLNQQSINNESIELYSTVIHRPAFICNSCKPNANKIGQFWIIEDYPHELEKMCLMCSCSSDEHIQIDYLNNYKLINSSSISNKSELIDQKKILCHGSAAFAYFLLHIVQCTKEDPFLIGLTRMIKQEEKILTQFQRNNFNLQLIKDLAKLKQIYKQQINEIVFNEDQNNLDFIYKWINKINQIPMIKEQVLAMKKGQLIRIKQHQVEPIEIKHIS